MERIGKLGNIEYWRQQKIPQRIYCCLFDGNYLHWANSYGYKIGSIKKQQELTNLRTEALSRLPKRAEVDAEIEIQGQNCTLTYNFEELYLKALQELHDIRKVKIIIESMES